MPFSITVPYEDGPSVPIEVVNPVTGSLTRVEGYLATGSEDNLISPEKARECGLTPVRDKTYVALVILDNGEDRISKPINFQAGTAYGRDVVIGINFLKYFKFVLDGVNKTVTLSV